VLDKVLKPRLPPDAVVYLAFTRSDLWPGESWNYVFGQGSLADRVGVWSIKRFGNPDKSADDYRLVLRRTLQSPLTRPGTVLAASLHFYECCMNGSNHLAESDRQPLWLCPQCLAKLCYSTGANPEKRFKDLIALAKAHELIDEIAFWENPLATLRMHDAE